MTLLRQGLLSGRSVALAGQVPDPVRDGLTGLGARVESVPDALPEEDDAVGAWAREQGPLHAVVFDARSAFGGGGPEALIAALERAWAAVREVATGALIEGDGPGKVVLLGPSADAGPLADSARDGLENLVRTLSVEWARYGITAVMVAPGPRTGDDVLAEVVAFLCSPGGEYLSGCRLEVGAVTG
jgi:NAD(P)-dependent dehydrogenase (short-subunit alcohol dehydrogenase family)